MEIGSFALLAFEPNFAPMLFYYSFYGIKPQAGAHIFFFLGVLRAEKFAENILLVFLRYAYAGVLHAHFECTLFLFYSVAVTR